MKIKLNKIASVTKNAELGHTVMISTSIPANNGQLVVVEVMEDKKIYNQLELVSGRMSTLKKGDIIAVALGNRKALKGFVGKTPEKIKKGDVINVLNLGGVAGICTSENVNEVGHALKVKVLGAIVKHNKPINIVDFSKFKPAPKVTSKVPLIVVSGTCMNVGKTTVACEITKFLADKGLKICAAKLAGVAALKDTENMLDYGAENAISFLDAGLTSTVQDKNFMPNIVKGAINHLSQKKPDYIVIEFGDGVYGEYGVFDILSDKEVQKNIVCHVGCAHDPMGAAKLIEVCEQIGAPLSMVSGPVSDNEVGVSFVKNSLGLPAFNAMSKPKELSDYLYKTCLK